MRLVSIVFAASMAGSLALLAQSPAVRPGSTAPPDLSDVFPAGQARPDQFALTADGRRTYFVDTAGEAWLYDRAQKTKSRVTVGPLWDLNLSPAGNALAYTKGGAERGDQYVWVLALDPASGLPRGAERRVSTHQGDAPSISPDGSLVAFARDQESGVGQSLVVVPVAGGAERVVVAAIPSSVANIRWTPDARTLYFGVNPPVACVPEWSCLPLTQELRQPPGRIRKVAASGGPVADVTTARGLAPGLSPDGTTLLYLETGTARRWVVANADGSRRDTVTLPPSESPVGWLKGSSVLLATSGNLRRLRAMTLADGQSRIVADGADTLMDPAWSPDGTHMTVVARGTPRAELRVLKTDGSLERAIALPENFANGSAWSPDGRWIAYLGFGENPPAHLALVEIATGRARSLSDVSTDGPVSFRWLAGSHGIVLTETFGGQASKRRVAIRTLDLDGKSTTVREFSVGASPGGAVAIDDTTAIVAESAQTPVRVVRLTGAGSERELLPARAGDSSSFWLSPDGQWLTLRRAESPAGAPQTNVLELARIDGSVRRTIPLSFVPAPGNNPRVIPGGGDLVVLEGRRPDAEPGAYLVSAGTQTARKLFTYSAQNQPPELAISPDGRTLLYLVWENVPPSLRAIDLSATGR